MTDYAYPDYEPSMDVSNITLPPVEISATVVGFITCAIIAFLLSGFLLVVIIIDRQTYRKAQLLTSLNYMLNYVLFLVFEYFYTIHIHMLNKMPRSTCDFILVMFAVLEEGTKYFILPICIDFIIQHFRPSLHEKRNFVFYELIFMGALWAIIFIKEISVLLSDTDREERFCSVILTDKILYSQMIFTFLFLCAVVVCLSLLLYIVTVNRQNLRKMFNELGATVTLLFLLIVIHVLYVSSTISQLSGMQQHSLYEITFYVQMVGTKLLPLAWLCDGSIRNSIWRLLCGRCSTPRKQPEHELTTEIE
ncbi:uncharacterized protein LOC115220990 [Argonauta hians]